MTRMFLLLSLLLPLTSNADTPYGSEDSIQRLPSSNLKYEDHVGVESPWSFSAHLGLNSPQGTFGNSYDGGQSFGIDVEYRWDQQYAAELYVGQDTFDGSSGLPDVDALQISVNGKYYFPFGVNEGYTVAGFGSYDFDPGSSETGFNVGIGMDVIVNPDWSLEALLKYHTVDTSGSSLEFYTLQGVVRFGGP